MTFRGNFVISFFVTFSSRDVKMGMGGLRNT